MVEPTVCVPRVKGTMRAATAAADPDDDPPGVRETFQGLTVGAGSAYANSVVWSLPRTTAPAARSRATLTASTSGTTSTTPQLPARVGSPATWKISLMPTGTPWSGPRKPPWRASWSRSVAVAMAPSASTTAHARTTESRAAMRSRQAPTSTRLVVRPARTAAAASAAESS